MMLKGCVERFFGDSTSDLDLGDCRLLALMTQRVLGSQYSPVSTRSQRTNPKGLSDLGTSNFKTIGTLSPTTARCFTPLNFT